jgi:very-short-patch-repair endonuclease
VRQGRWLVLNPHWTTTGTRPERREAQWRHELYVAIFSCSPRVRATVVCFRRTAAALWGLDGVEPRIVELAVTSGRPSPGSLYRPRSFEPAEIARVDGLRVTSVTRTLLDLGQVVGPEIVERSLESALRKRYVSVDALAAAVDAAPRLRGAGALRSVLARRPAGAPPTESDAETLFLQLARRAGLPDPLRQFAVPTSEGAFRLDFAWPHRRIAVEIDGAATHASRDALSRDLRRQNRILLSMVPAGWALLRFTWDDLVDPRFAAQLVDKLREAWVIGLNDVPSAPSAPSASPSGANFSWR